MDVDLRRIPIRQETIEVCERLDVDPYKLEAKGSVLHREMHWCGN